MEFVLVTRPFMAGRDFSPHLRRPRGRKIQAMNTLRALLREDDGQDMIEYGLLAAFISIVAIATIKLIGPLVSTMYTNIQTAVTP